MKAKLVVQEKAVFPDGSFIEMVAWQVLHPVTPSRHLYKYRLVYIENGERILGYDNERGKGDHRHAKSMETPISFTSLEALSAQFLAEVAKLRGLE